MSNEEVIQEIESEIKKAKAEPEEFQIEITEDPAEEAKDVAEEAESKLAEDKSEKDPNFGPKIEKRIKKLVSQRRDAEVQVKSIQEENAQLIKRIERLEKGSQQNNQQAFNKKYADTKAALTKAVEEGDTEAQVNFQEQMADMRAAMRIAEMQKQQRAQQAASPTVGRAQQVAQDPAPEKAMAWWQQNNWFNAQGYERETAAARAIDVQLDLEGFDKNEQEYYDTLNNRLHNVFPELVSNVSPTSKPRTKSRTPVAPTTGGSSSYKGNRVRMTQDQLRMARELGITDENSLKKYEAEIKRQQRS
jgi:hypothetical protein